MGGRQRPRGATAHHSPPPLLLSTMAPPPGAARAVGLVLAACVFAVHAVGGEAEVGAHAARARRGAGGAPRPRPARAPASKLSGLRPALGRWRRAPHPLNHPSIQAAPPSTALLLTEASSASSPDYIACRTESAYDDVAGAAPLVGPPETQGVWVGGARMVPRARCGAGRGRPCPRPPSAGGAGLSSPLAGGRRALEPPPTPRAARARATPADPDPPASPRPQSAPPGLAAPPRPPPTLP